MQITSQLKIDDIANKRWGNKHEGETAIIIGNGSSLINVPKKLLNKYTSFGSNRIHCPPVSFQPTYFSSIDTKYLTKYAHEMYDAAKNAEIAFLSMFHILYPNPDLQKLYALNNVQLLDRETVMFPGEIWYTGKTVTYVALKIAYFMGFETTLLVGCDHEEEYQHFYGKHYDVLPSSEVLGCMRYHYYLADVIYKEDNRKIINLSPNSMLDEVLERGRIEDYLE